MVKHNKPTNRHKKKNNQKQITQAEMKKAEVEKTEAEKTEAEKTEAEKTEAEKTEAEKTEAEKTEAEKTEAEKTEAEKTEAEKTEAKQTCNEVFYALFLAAIHMLASIFFNNAYASNTTIIDGYLIYLVVFFAAWYFILPHFDISQQIHTRKTMDNIADFLEKNRLYLKFYTCNLFIFGINCIWIKYNGYILIHYDLNIFLYIILPNMLLLIKIFDFITRPYLIKNKEKVSNIIVINFILLITSATWANNLIAEKLQLPISDLYTTMLAITGAFFPMVFGMFVLAITPILLLLFTLFYVLFFIIITILYFIITITQISQYIPIINDYFPHHWNLVKYHFNSIKIKNICILITIFIILFLNTYIVFTFYKNDGNMKNSFSYLVKEIAYAADFQHMETYFGAIEIENKPMANVLKNPKTKVRLHENGHISLICQMPNGNLSEIFVFKDEILTEKYQIDDIVKGNNEQFNKYNLEQVTMIYQACKKHQ